MSHTDCVTGGTVKKKGNIPESCIGKNKPHIFRGWGGWAIRYNGAPMHLAMAAEKFIKERKS